MTKGFKILFLVEGLLVICAFSGALAEDKPDQDNTYASLPFGHPVGNESWTMNNKGRWYQCGANSYTPVKEPRNIAKEVNDNYDREVKIANDLAIENAKLKEGLAIAKALAAAKPSLGGNSFTEFKSPRNDLRWTIEITHASDPYVDQDGIIHGGNGGSVSIYQGHGIDDGCLIAAPSTHWRTPYEGNKIVGGQGGDAK